MDFIAGIVTIEAFGDYLLALYAKESAWWQLGLGYGSYAILLSMFIKAIKEKGLAWANSAWDGWSNLATGLVALILLKERPTLKELLGMGLISAGLFLLGTRGTAAR
jgi:multidrug transporter EmrE-like cation transporter